MSTEYGWTDEQVGGLTVARLRQCVAAITERRVAEAYQARKRSEWEVRTICTFIASTVPTDGSESPLLDLAYEIGTPAEVREDQAPMVPSRTKEPRPGSFEQASMLFGMMSRGR